MHNVLALLGALIATVSGILWISPLYNLFDSITVVLALCGPGFLLIYTYGYADVSRHLLGGYARVFFPGKQPLWYDTDHAKTARMAKSGMLFSLMTGGLFILFGAIAMLQNLSDPSAIGPALAVALFSLLYAVLVSTFFFVPMIRFHASEARALSVKDEDGTLLHSAWVFMLVSFTILGTFSILMLIFAGGDA